MIGIDIEEVGRIKDYEKLLNKIARDSEIEYINLSNNTIARQRTTSLFCVKEAVMKALGMGQNSGVVFKDIELCHEESGKPYVILHGKAKTHFDKFFAGKKIEVSLSHTKNVATAVAIII